MVPAIDRIPECSCIHSGASLTGTQPCDDASPILSCDGLESFDLRDQLFLPLATRTHTSVPAFTPA